MTSPVRKESPDELAKAAFMRADAAFRVRSSAVGQRWSYVFSVVVALTCPRALAPLAGRPTTRDSSGGPVHLAPSMSAVVLPDDDRRRALAARPTLSSDRLAQRPQKSEELGPSHDDLPSLSCCGQVPGHSSFPFAVKQRIQAVCLKPSRVFNGLNGVLGQGLFDQPVRCRCWRSRAHQPSAGSSCPG